jgi:hypothetical protein
VNIVLDPLWQPTPSATNVFEEQQWAFLLLAEPLTVGLNLFSPPPPPPRPISPHPLHMWQKTDYCITDRCT